MQCENKWRLELKRFIPGFKKLALKKKTAMAGGGGVAAYVQRRLIMP
jgi:hypothetical protein